MSHVLVAGVGNIFFGDDAFGVEVVRQLALDPPPHARILDVGIRARHLAYELCGDVDLCVIADCMARGGEPGTLYVLEPEAAAAGSVADAHALALPSVFAAVRELGGQMPRTLVVGCEPDTLDPVMELSAPVARAVPEAVRLIRDLIDHPPEVTP